MSFEVFENISYQNLSKLFSLTKEGYKNTSDIKNNNYDLNEIKFLKSISSNTVKNLKRTYYLYVGETR